VFQNLCQITDVCRRDSSAANKPEIRFEGLLFVKVNPEDDSADSDGQRKKGGAVNEKKAGICGIKVRAVLHQIQETESPRCKYYK
jgi:hypothetical protein